MARSRVSSQVSDGVRERALFQAAECKLCGFFCSGQPRPIEAGAMGAGYFFFRTARQPVPG